MAINNLSVKIQINTLCGEAKSILKELDAGGTPDASARLARVINRLVAIQRQLDSAREGVKFRNSIIAKGLQADQRFGLDQSTQAKGQSLSELAQAAGASHKEITKALDDLLSRLPGEGKAPPELWNMLIGNGEDFIGEMQKAEQQVSKILSDRHAQSHSAVDQAEVARIRQDLSYLRTHQDNSASSILTLTILLLRLVTFLRLKNS